MLENVWSYKIIYVNCEVSISVTVYEIIVAEICVICQVSGHWDGRVCPADLAHSMAEAWWIFRSVAVVKNWVWSSSVSVVIQSRLCLPKSSSLKELLASRLLNRCPSAVLSLTSATLARPVLPNALYLLVRFVHCEVFCELFARFCELFAMFLHEIPVLTTPIL